MTLSDALSIVCLLHSRRQLLASVVRTCLGRPIPDIDELPARLPQESVLDWVCRGVPIRPGEPLPDPQTARDEAARHVARAHAAGISGIIAGTSGYPPALAAIPDPPLVLWVAGRASSVSQPAVALVGSRAASAYGLEMARALGTELASRGVTIVSGLARGIDSAAHRAALDAGGNTVAVLGSGLDRIYPPEHAALADGIVQSGALVGELPPGTPPLPHHFPWRNRIISGLAQAVVVVEASEKSGSLITAACALEQGREVMAVPGPARSSRFRGAHDLLRDGAKLVESADDILQELHAGDATEQVPRQGRPDDLDLGVPAEVTDFTVDEVAEWTGSPASAVLPRLLELELAGRIQRIEGGRFVRASRRRANVVDSAT